jgi:DNA-binding NarL/FixJ family response regulator
MRVALVGTSAERAWLRARLHPALEIAAEFPTLSAARAAAVPVDALVVAPAGPDVDAEAQEPLTPRELEVLELLAHGLSNKGIAARLGISDQTVKFHLASLSSKLGAANRTDAVRRAVRRGLIAL